MTGITSAAAPPLALRRADAGDVAALTLLQHAAFGPNRAIIGVEPLPLLADYAAVLAGREAWLCDGASGSGGDGLDAALILEPRPEDLLVWSVAVAPHAQGRGLGSRLLACAEDRAAALGRDVLRLYTHEKLTRNIAWYRWHGYAIERHEQMPDRVAVHMVKTLR